MLPHVNTNDKGEYHFENLPWWGRYSVYGELPVQQAIANLRNLRLHHCRSHPADNRAQECGAGLVDPRFGRTAANLALILDAAGDLYGTTSNEGAGFGTVFKITQ